MGILDGKSYNQLDCNPLKAGGDAISDKTLIFPQSDKFSKLSQYDPVDRPLDRESGNLSYSLDSAKLCDFF